MGGIFSVISKLFWGEAKPVVMEQMNTDEGVREMEQLVAQVSEVKRGECVFYSTMGIFHQIHVSIDYPQHFGACKIEFASILTV